MHAIAKFNSGYLSNNLLKCYYGNYAGRFVFNIIVDCNINYLIIGTEPSECSSFAVCINNSIPAHD